MTKRTRPAPAPSPLADSPRTRPPLLGPRVLYPALGLLAATSLALGVLLALGVTGNEPQKLVVTSCQGGTPGCQLRAPTHLHANFALVIRGQPFNFNQDQFLSVEGNDRSPFAHLHEPRFDVVHVHRTGTFWDEFLKSIGFELTDPTLVGITADKTCLKMPDGQKLCNGGSETFKFYVNGVKVEGLANASIGDLDRVLISFGAENDAAVLPQLSLTGDDACIPSERCPDRIPKGEPPEPCTKSNDTCVKPGG